MISSYFKSLTPFIQGNILIAIGVVLLFNALGIANLNMVVILLALALLWSGLSEAGYIAKLMNLINKTNG